MQAMRAAFTDDLPHRDQALEVQRLCRAQGALLSLHDAHAVWTQWRASVASDTSFVATDDGPQRRSARPFPSDPDEVRSLIDRFCTPLV